MKDSFNVEKPKLPRYRVSCGIFNGSWRIATDEDLIKDGYNPNDYRPLYDWQERDKPWFKCLVLISMVSDVLYQMYNFFKK